MSLIVVSNDVNVPYITDKHTHIRDKHTRIPKKKTVAQKARTLICNKRYCCGLVSHLFQRFNTKQARFYNPHSCIIIRLIGGFQK